MNDETEPGMERPSRIYYSRETKDRPATIIFDMGYPAGNVHVYELKETRDSREVRKEVEDLLGGTAPEGHNYVRYWAENRGALQSWRLAP